MILQALYRLAQSEELMPDPDYEPKPVAWLVRVSRKGELLGIEGTHQFLPPKQKKGKPKAIPKYFAMPREGGRTSNDRAFFLYDKAQYIFGMDPERDQKKRRPQEQLRSRFAMFRDRVNGCLAATSDEGVRAVKELLDDVAAGTKTVVLPENCATNDLFTFIYAPDTDRLVTHREKVREYWKTLRKQEAVQGGAARHCMVSGDAFAGTVVNFPQTKNVPGKNTAKGISLISFNKSAFESYGWLGNENAPISRDAAEACATALDRLLHPAYPDPHQSGQTLPPRNLRLSADTMACFWSAEKSGDEFCFAFAGLLEANPVSVRELYRSLWRGKAPEIAEPSAFYALTLSGTQGRAIVRDWFESTVAKVAQNLALHFSDLDIVRNTPQPKDHHLPPQLPLTLLLRSLAAGGETRNIPAPFIAHLCNAALHGTPYPLCILQRALERARAEVGRETQEGLEGYQAKERNDARAALIKAVLNRRKRFFPDTTHYKEVHPDMDPTNPSEGYALGRLMAVLERIQQEAMGDVNASVVDRYFSGASATPKTVFVRLLKNTRHHVAKAKDDEAKAGLVFRLDRLIDELASRFDPKHNGFPAHLDLEQQGLFVLGYHQMRKWIWMPREERAEWEKLHPEAPREYLWSKGKE
jgi:CRISPR-associated protein Csd1